MKKLIATAAFVALGLATVSARGVTVRGTYVEARTAEVFAGACVVNSEAGMGGREALLAWKVDRGRFNGVALDGLAVVAAVAADENLGVHEIGGATAHGRAVLYVDARASAAQRKALAAMAKTLARDTVGAVIAETPAAIEFASGPHAITVSAQNVKLAVQKHLDHDPTCGNKQWFHPLAQVEAAEMGATDENAFSGPALGRKWSDPNKRSGFFGTFAY